MEELRYLEFLMEVEVALCGSWGLDAGGREDNTRKLQKAAPHNCGA